MTDKKYGPGQRPSPASSGENADRGHRRPGPATGNDKAGSGKRPHAPDSRNNAPSPFPRDRDHKEGRDGKGRSPGGAVGALIELDRDLMKLLVRRATLVSRIRGGKEHAASPAAIQAEKAVRIAWETGALAFSKDPRFSRQLFALLQDIKVLGKEEAEQSGSFTLKPRREPVSGGITGPSSTRAAQMRLMLAAFLGKPLRLEPLMFSAPLIDSSKACEQCGAALSRGGDKPGLSWLRLDEGTPLSLAGRSVFLGDDPFTAYLFLFFALGRPGVCRLNGGSALKSLDLAPLRHTLPLFGARLAHVVPNSNGLPANLECSGEIPPHVLVPAELPEEALSALLLAPLVWNLPVTLDLSALPAAIATAALAEVRPLHKDCGADVDGYGPRLSFTPSPVTPPEAPLLPLDPALSAYFLAVPAFTGGSLELRGTWPSDAPEAAEARQLFAWAGLEFAVSEHSVATSRPGPGADGKKPAHPAFSLPMQCGDISASLGPLFLALCALCLAEKGEVPALRTLLTYPDNETDNALAAEFFERLGLRCAEGRLAVAGKEDSASEIVPSWTSPDIFWSLAYALGAFLRPGLQLANPATVSARMPLFWAVYNSLPNASDSNATARKKEDSGSDRTARRRIIAD